MSESCKSLSYLALAFVVAGVFADITFYHTTEMPIIKDAGQNTRAAYHLVHAGVISTDRESSETPRPQMRREPLPIVVTAGFLLLHPTFNAPYTIDELLKGRLTETVKSVNAFWRFLAAIFIFLLCLELFADKRVAAAMALTCLIASEVFFFSTPSIVDRMYTELPESAAMLLASWCAVRFVRTKTKLNALCLGIALGLLALSKAAFLYIGLCFIILLLLTDQRGQQAWSKVFSSYAVIALAMFLAVAPWIARNMVTFGKPQIVAGTDASVLGLRLLLMQQPLLGQLYLYSPDALKCGTGPLTGYSQEDLKSGGRLDPVKAVKDEREGIFAERMAEEGYRGDQRRWVRQAALRYAVENPVRYIASTGVFAYKGMWFMDRAGVLINLAALLCFFGVFFGALFTRNQVLLAAFGLPAGLFFFISIFTHALTRYNMPMTPFVILSVLWLTAALAREAYRRYPGVRNLVDRWLRRLQPSSDASSSSQRRPTLPTSSAETASRA